NLNWWTSFIIWARATRLSGSVISSSIPILLDSSFKRVSGWPWLTKRKPRLKPQSQPAPKALPARARRPQPLLTNRRQPNPPPLRRQLPQRPRLPRKLVRPPNHRLLLQSNPARPTDRNLTSRKRENHIRDPRNADWKSAVSPIGNRRSYAPRDALHIFPCR